MLPSNSRIECMMPTRTRIVSSWYIFAYLCVGTAGTMARSRSTIWHRKSMSASQCWYRFFLAQGRTAAFSGWREAVLGAMTSARADKVTLLSFSKSA